MIKNLHDKYLILLIITDGAIHDMEETINSIIDGCDLPLSILIIGVGDADFDNMEVCILFYFLLFILIEIEIRWR